MRWEDEPYVKIYVRDTPEFLAMSLGARCLLHELIRKVDRAGCLKVGRLGIEGVALAVRASREEVEAPVNELLRAGRLVWHEGPGYFLIPNHIEAQTTPQSDASRKRRGRECARASLSRLKSTDNESRTVTSGHVESRAVTSGHVESRLEENRIESTEEIYARRPPCVPVPSPSLPSSPPATVQPIAKDRPLSTEGSAYAQTIGVTEVDRVYRDFVNYNLSEGKVAADWEAKWRRWCDHELRIQRRDRERARPRRAPLQQDEPGAPRGWEMPTIVYPKKEIS